MSKAMGVVKGSPQGSVDEDYVQADENFDFSELELVNLAKKFRCKRDLYSYLETRGKQS